MSHQGPPGTLKVGLKRADAWELVVADAQLARCPLVLALGAQAESALRQATVRRYRDGLVLFQQGDEGAALVLVLAGEVRLLARGDSDRVELGTVAKGEVLGEVPLLEGNSTRQASAVAQGQVDVAELPPETLLVQGALPAGLAAFLKQVREARARALDEMSDFLNRW